MRYSFISAAILALVSSVSAALPTDGFDVITVPSPNSIDSKAVGDDYTIQWVSTSAYSAGTVSIALMSGSSNLTLSVGDFIATGIANSLNSYKWTIPTTVVKAAVYGIQISWDKDTTIFQWSNQFHITSTGSTSSYSASGTASSSVSATSTKTMTLATGTAYTASSSAAKLTSSVASNSTTLTTAASSQFTAASNATLSGTASLTASKTSAGTSSSATSSGAAAKSSSAAAANIVKGSFAAIGGVILAFAL